MNASSLRRLASDQCALRRATPPNYLFPLDQASSALPNDLTQLTILLTGAQGTPYAHGLWRLYLKMPDDYPKNPPKATFKTRIFHPNVDETTGAVCLETLQRDWSPKLTLKDILITISCLLIHPNPDSALNSAAGALLQDDYEAFSKKAGLMASIHAPIPRDLHEAVRKAKQRGEDGGKGPQVDQEERPASVRASPSNTSIVMKDKARALLNKEELIERRRTGNPSKSDPIIDTFEDEEGNDEAKENSPSQSPSSPRKHLSNKRPLSELLTLIEPDENEAGMSASEDNISATLMPTSARLWSTGPTKKSPKLVHSGQEFNSSAKTAQELEPIAGRDGSPLEFISPDLSDEKENFGSEQREKTIDMPKTALSTRADASVTAKARLTSRKVSNVGSARSRGQARIGLRRI